MTIALDVHGKSYGSVLSNDQAIAGAATVYSNTLFVGGCTQIGIWIKLLGATPDVGVLVEYSPTIDPGDFSEVEGGSKIMDVTNILVHNEVVIVKLSNYMRLKLVGAAGNGVDVTADIVVNIAK